MKKILLITQYFPPDMAGTGRVMQELAEDLSSSGFEVQVLTGTSHYFNKQMCADVSHKIPVKRIWHPRFSNLSKAGRLCNFISFPLFLMLRFLTFRRADAILIVSNPPTIAAVGAIINRVWRKKVYYILQDIYPDLAIHLGAIKKRSLLARSMRKLNAISFRYVERIIVLTVSMEKYLISSYHLPEAKVVTISNWADNVNIHPIPKDNPWSQASGYVDKFVILYAGNIGFVYDFDPILEAAEELKTHKDVVFVFVGEGAHKEKLLNQVHTRRLKNVDFMSYVADKDYNKLLASADIQVVLQSPGMERYNFPGKVYSSLASGRPIIAISNKGGELASLIAHANSGFTVEDSKELINTILKLKKDTHLRATLGESGKKYLLNNYSRNAMTDKYGRLLSNEI